MDTCTKRVLTGGRRRQHPSPDPSVSQQVLLVLPSPRMITTRVSPSPLLDLSKSPTTLAQALPEAPNLPLPASNLFSKQTPALSFESKWIMSNHCFTPSSGFPVHLKNPEISTWPTKCHIISSLLTSPVSHGPTLLHIQ